MTSERSPGDPTPRVTREEQERYSDEDEMRSAQDEQRLRDEAPPHHR
ncbi:MULTISPECIES: hypothetical protein [Mycobacterium]|nr:MULTISPECIES: hypothetical protein [Mycobacterium]